MSDSNMLPDWERDMLLSFLASDIKKETKEINNL